LAAGLNARASLSPQPSTTVVAAIAEMAPSDTVGLRFPADWAEPSAEPAARMVTLASADPGMIFSPQPTYAANAADAPTMDAPTTMIEAKPQPAAAAPPKLAVASLAPKPPKPRSNAVLNDSQLASIKRRLNLTPEQERYWPAIEAELRKMEYARKSQGGSRTASIDMSKVNVEGLKSAGFPLVMSFSDDQRRELKSLAHLLGLESVMAGL
jgi:hypothetical protein